MENMMNQNEEYASIPLSLIQDEKNIRKQCSPDDRSIEELARSMQIYGQLQPIRVYKTDSGSYAILFGHRRYYAAKKAGIDELKCVVCENPNSIDRLYIQAIENEQNKRLSSADREDYITTLLNVGESAFDICKKIGKSPSWISQIIKAKIGRDSFGTKFIEAGIELDTYGAYQIAGASPEAVDDAIKAIKEMPSRKKAILKELSLSKPKTSKRGRPQMYAAQETSLSVSEQSMLETVEGAPSTPKQMPTFQHSISVDEEHKSVTIRFDATNSDLMELHTMINDLVRAYFEKKEYTVIVPAL